MGRWQLPGLLLLLAVAIPVAAQDETKTPDAVEAVTGPRPEAPAAPDPDPEPVAEPVDSEANEKSREALAIEVDGFLKTALFFRNASNENDADWLTDFAVDAKKKGETPVTLRAYGRLHVDFAGDQETDPKALLRDVWDNYNDPNQLKMYELYAKIDRIGDQPNSLWLGRQFVDEGIWLWFDGARFDWSFDKSVEGLSLSVFGGLPVRWSEERIREDNWLVGALLRWRISPQWRFRFEYYHLSEYFSGINDGITDGTVAPVTWPARHLDDDFAGFSLWWTPDRRNNVFGRFTLLNGKANELQLRWRWRSKDTRWTVLVDYYQLFQRLTNVANELTPYVPLLGFYQPFARVGARGTYRIDDRWVLQLGLSHRSLIDEEDEGIYNREYNHGYLSLSVLNLADNRVDITLFANGYTSQDNDVAAATGNVDWRFVSDWRLSAGIDYQLYKYDIVADTERENIWVYYAKLRWDINRRMDANLDLSYESTDVTDWTNVYLYFRWRF